MDAGHYCDELEAGTSLNPESCISGSFAETLSRSGLRLTRDKTTTLQVNIGLTCNLSCLHCHLHAGPHRKEMMKPETFEHVMAYAACHSFETIDITGGAPELNPHIEHFVLKLAPLTPRLLIRTNLTALDGEKWVSFINLCRTQGVTIIASFPSINEDQTDSQRGKGNFNKMINSLKKLNASGYGLLGSGLELNLVSNPPGAFLPGAQVQAEKRFRDILLKKWGICFNHLYQFANVPLGRFYDWLVKTENLHTYKKKLMEQFSAEAVSFLMCRQLISVDWQGYLHDCDFNLAKGLGMGGHGLHITDMKGLPQAGSPIAISDICYTCTAGTGFT